MVLRAGLPRRVRGKPPGERGPRLRQHGASPHHPRQPEGPRHERTPVRPAHRVRGDEVGAQPLVEDDPPARHHRAHRHRHAARVGRGAHRQRAEGRREEVGRQRPLPSPRLPHRPREVHHRPRRDALGGGPLLGPRLGVRQGGPPPPRRDRRDVEPRGHRGPRDEQRRGRVAGLPRHPRAPGNRDLRDMGPGDGRFRRGTHRRGDGSGALQRDDLHHRQVPRERRQVRVRVHPEALALLRAADGSLHGLRRIQRAKRSLPAVPDRGLPRPDPVLQRHGPEPAGEPEAVQADPRR